MTTRHVSAETSYPFVSATSAQARLHTGGILDLYFVVQGPPTGQQSSSGASSLSPDQTSGESVNRWVDLVYYEAIGSITRFTFYVREGEDRWDVFFDVPNTGGVTGQVHNADTTYVNAVLVYNSEDVIDTGEGWVGYTVEPSRAQFHTEQVNSFTFRNISRCAGSEDPTVLFDAFVLQTGSSSGEVHLDLVLEDGYNCAVSFLDELIFSGELAVGKGTAPDFGNTDPLCTEDPNDALEFIVTTVNGIAPVNGGIPVIVSGGLGAQRMPGRIEIISRL